MLSKELNNSLIKFLSELINCENAVQINREVLSESADFDAHQIFNYILSTDENNITILDIKKYLNDNGIEISEQEAKLIILFYDINFDGKLSFEEFLNFVRSEKSSLNNKTFRIQDTNLSFNINYSLCKLFQTEITVTKRIRNVLKELRSKKEFNVHDIFHALKSGTFITLQSLKNYLIKNNFDKCQYISLCKQKCTKCGISYCKDCFLEKHGCDLIHNPLDKIKNKAAKKENIENKNPNIILNEENENNENIDNKNNNITKENSLEIKELNDYIKFLLKGENKIENIKINLSKIPDFSVEDAFRIFEKNGRGYLDREDIKYGLSVLNLYPSEYNLDLFIKRYDLQKKGFISYEDFFDMVVPFEKEFRLNMNKRIPKSNCPQSYLGKEINNMLNSLFKFLIDFENKANIEKKSLNIDFKDVFNELDTEKQGYFNFENFLDYLKGYELIEENINPDLLYIRLDKNRNGIIDLEEFAEEMIPL